MGMLIGVAVGVGARARAGYAKQTRSIRRCLNVEIRFLGHAAASSSAGARRGCSSTRSDGEPEGRRRGVGGRAHARLPHARAPGPLGDVVEIAKRTSFSIAITGSPTSWATRSRKAWPIRISAGPPTSTAAGCGWCPLGTRRLRRAAKVNTPAGLVIRLGGKTVYHLGDTALFSDLRLVGQRDEARCRAHVHRRPLHDGPPRRRGGLRASRGPHGDPVPLRHVPPIETDAQAFKADVEGRTGSTVEVLEPGRSASRAGSARRAGTRSGGLSSRGRPAHADRREQQAGGSVGGTLAAEPEPAAYRVEADQLVTVCPWPGHCASPHYL